MQADRVGRGAQAARASFNAHVVLKGNGSVLVARDGHWFINTSGNPGMASAGMGDVLAGILGALLAQRYTGETALVLGVHLHGAAADALAAAGAGPVGLTAGELIEPRAGSGTDGYRMTDCSAACLASPAARRRRHAGSALICATAAACGGTTFSGDTASVRLANDSFELRARARRFRRALQRPRGACTPRTTRPCSRVDGRSSVPATK